MSHGCTAATTPFKVNVWEGEPEYDPNQPEDSECDDPTICRNAPKGFQEVYVEYLEVNSGRKKESQIRGWTLRPHCKIAPKSPIYGHPLTKGNFTVFYVNESEYENVGYEDASFVSTDKDAIEEFRKDFEFGKFKIQTNVPVLSWS